MRKWLIGLCVVWLAALPLVISGCGSASSKSSVIRIGIVQNAVVSLPLYEMESNQELSKEGYAIQWINFDSPASLADAFLANKIDVDGAIGVSTLGNIVSNGAPIKIIFVNGYASSARIYSKTLTNIEQVRGKRLGMPPASMETSEIACFLLEKKCGLDPTRDFKLINTTDMAGAMLLEKGDINAFLAYGSTAVNLEQLGFHQIFDLSQAWAKYSNGSHLVTSVTVVQTPFADTHQQFIQAFTKAYTAAVKTLLENPSTIGQIASQQFALESGTLPNFVSLAQVQLQGASGSKSSLMETEPIIAAFGGSKISQSDISSLYIN